MMMVLSCCVVCLVLLELLLVLSVSGLPVTYTVDGAADVYRRLRRDQTSCGATLPPLTTSPMYGFAEKKDRLRALWMKRDKLLMVASDSSSTTLYVGTSSPTTHLYKPNQDTTSIPGPVNLKSLKMTVGMSAVMLESADRHTLHVSKDMAKTWSHYHLPGDGLPHDLVFSTVRSGTMTLHTRTGHLYLSRDYGATWKHIDSNVILSTLVPSSNTESLFYAKMSTNKVFNPLYRVDLTSLQSKLIDSKSYLYVVDNKYLYVSRQNFTGSIKTSEQTRRFYVSTNFDSNQPTFSEVQLPAAKWEDYVAVMGTHETGAFIHISNRNDQDKGDLYVSGKSGSQFTVSLRNHLLKRININLLTHFKLLTFDDFYEVKSVRGVYISTQVDGGNHYSVITFDNGGAWQRIPPPHSSQCNGCSLHVHVTYSQFAGAFKTGPLSSRNAPGIIIAHGSIGVYRQYNASDAQIVISQNGGLDWTIPSIPKGMYNYGIADYGNIIAIVPDSKSARYIWFSHDRGRCFKKENFGFSNLFRLSQGLLMDPNTTSLYAFVLGSTGTGSDKTWTAIAIYFGSILSYPCHESDYITQEQPKCILGYKESYHITKPESLCYNENYQRLKVTTVKCNCTDNDYECGFGFSPKLTNGILTCTKDPDFNLSMLCPPGEEYYQQSSTGLQLVAGDQCVATEETKAKLKVTSHPCTGHESDSGISVDVSSETGKIIGSLILLLVVVVMCALGLYCWLRCRSKPTTTRDRVIYKKIPLTTASTDNSSSDEDLLK